MPDAGGRVKPTRPCQDPPHRDRSRRATPATTSTHGPAAADRSRLRPRARSTALFGSGHAAGGLGVREAGPADAAGRGHGQGHRRDVAADAGQPARSARCRPTGAGTTHVEIYVPEQVLAVFTDDKPAPHRPHLHRRAERRRHTAELVRDGHLRHRRQRRPAARAGHQGRSAPTPRRPAACSGSPRRYEGNHVSPLGGMFNPVYFNYGIAIHGAAERAAGAGVARLRADQPRRSPRRSRTMVEQGRPGLRVGPGRQAARAVHRSDESLPSFNYADPNATTTTASTTTTLPATTVDRPGTTTTRGATTVPKTTTTTAPKVAPTTTTWRRPPRSRRPPRHRRRRPRRRRA